MSECVCVCVSGRQSVVVLIVLLLHFFVDEIFYLKFFFLAGVRGPPKARGPKLKLINSIC